MKINRLFSILFISIFCFCSFSCGDEEPEVMSPTLSENEEVNNDLEGKWDVESARIDGDESVGDDIEDFTMEFEIETDTGGDLVWRYKEYGVDQKLEDNYEIRSDGNELEWLGVEFTIVKLTSSKLELEGNLNGNYWEIQAEK